MISESADSQQSRFRWLQLVARAFEVDFCLSVTALMRPKSIESPRIANSKSSTLSLERPQTSAHLAALKHLFISVFGVRIFDEILILRTEQAINCRKKMFEIKLFI